MPIRDRNVSNVHSMEEVRRKLRNNPTREEALLWKKLRTRQVLGKKFRRQYSIGRYVVDFFCVQCDLAIELDGAPHFEPLVADYEAQRTAFLQGLGIEILRFENRIVRTNMVNIAAQIPALFETLSGMKMSELMSKIRGIGVEAPKPDSGKAAGTKD